MTSPRSFGRTNEQTRPVTFTRDYTEFAAGSVLVTFGRTRVLCTASVDEDVPRWMRGSGKGWVKLTAPYAGRHRRPEPWPELIPLARAYLARAPDRVVWGSEWPQSMLPMLKEPIPDHALLLDLLLDYTSDEAMIKRILVDNPALLYDFPK